MANEIIFNKATQEDAYGITLVRRKTWLATYPSEKNGITVDDIEAAINRRTIEEETLQRAERIQNKKNFQTWVAKDNGFVIGFIEVEKKDKKNSIRALYILPEYQNQHIGTELTNRALAWLEKDKTITCEVATYNTGAIDFYKKFGFIENGATTNEVAKLPSGKIIPEIEMILKN